MKYVRKAALAAGFAAVTALGMAMSDGDLTGKESVIAIGAGLLAGGAVYRVPNAPRD
jgi:hypothetical protein